MLGYPQPSGTEESESYLRGQVLPDAFETGDVISLFSGGVKVQYYLLSPSFHTAIICTFLFTFAFSSLQKLWICKVPTG